jgi:hypothetical protein
VYTSYALDDVNLLPRHWIAYDAVDVLVLTTSSEPFLSALCDDPQHAERKQALVEWVRRGGRLIIGVGKSQDIIAKLFDDPKNQDLAALLPARPRGAVAEGELPLLGQWIDPQATEAAPALAATRLEPKAGSRVLLRQPSPTGELPLLVLGPAGLGRTLMVGFDLDSTSLARWPKQSRFWNRLLGEIAAKPPSSPQMQNRFGGFNDTQITDLTAPLRQELDRFGEVPVISFGWVALFILLYIIVVGPLDYLFLKHVVKRLELTWITFPTVVFLVSTLAYFTAYYLKGDKLRINKVDVVDIDLHTKQAYGSSFFTLFSPRIQNYTIGVEPVNPAWGAAANGDLSASPVVSEFSGVNYGRGRSQGLFRRAYEYAPDASGLQGVPIRFWSTKAFQANWRQPLAAASPLIEADLSVVPDTDPPRLRGQLVSHLPGALEGAVFIFRGLVYPLESLLPETPRELAGVRHVRNVSAWLGNPGDTAGSAGRPWLGSHGSVDAKLFPLLFHQTGGDSMQAQPSHALRGLDQAWRLRDTNLGEIIIYGRLATEYGPAEEVEQNPITPGRLWLGALPASGSRPSLGGVLRQETYVRIYVPLRRS